MKLACICVVVLSTFIVKISSEKSELDKVALDLLDSLTDIISLPIAEFAGLPSETQEGQNELKAIFAEVLKKSKRIENDVLKEYLNSLPPDVRDTHKKAIGYLSMTFSGSYVEIIKYAHGLTNKSFNSLPKDIQDKIIYAGRKIDGLLNDIKNQAVYEEVEEVEKTNK